MAEVKQIVIMLSCCELRFNEKGETDDFISDDHFVLASFGDSSPLLNEEI